MGLLGLFCGYGYSGCGYIILNNGKVMAQNVTKYLRNRETSASRRQNLPAGYLLDVARMLKSNLEALVQEYGPSMTRANFMDVDLEDARRQPWTVKVLASICECQGWKDEIEAGRRSAA